MSEYKETMEVYRSAVEEYLENCFADQRFLVLFALVFVIDGPIIL